MPRIINEDVIDKIADFARRGYSKSATGRELNLDFAGKQELLRLLIEKVLYDGQGVEIQTIIPLGEQLHPIHRGG